MTLEARFWGKVDRTAGPSACWNWLGATQSSGYGRFLVGRRLDGAHRVAFEMLRGSIGDGLEIDHTCRNRRCVNPAHMETVTHAKNMERRRRVRPACGHEYTVKSGGNRRCAVCTREYERLRSRRRRAAKCV